MLRAVIRPAAPRPLLPLLLLLLFSPWLLFFLTLSFPFPVKSICRLKLSRRHAGDGGCHLVQAVRVYNAPIKARELGARTSRWGPKTSSWEEMEAIGVIYTPTRASARGARTRTHRKRKHFGFLPGFSPFPGYGSTGGL